MLVIRKGQMEVFSRYMRTQFEERMVVHLKTTFPEQIQSMSELDLRNVVQTNIDNAAKYDVIGESDVQRYLEYVVCYGPDFDTHPKTSWAGQILHDKDLAGTEKMNQIEGYELFILRDEQPWTSTDG